MVEVIKNQDWFDVESVKKSDRPLRLGIPSSMELTRVIRNDDYTAEYITHQEREITVGVCEYMDIYDGKVHYSYNVVMFDADEDKKVYKSRSFDGRKRKNDAVDKAREWALDVHKGLVE